MQEDRWEKYRVTPGTTTNKWEKYRIKENASLPLPMDEQPTNDIYDNPFLAAMAGIKHSFEKPVHGILQPLLESGYLGQDVSNASKNWAKRTQDIYDRASKDSPWATGIGEHGYRFARDIPLYALGGKALTGLTSKLSPGLIKWLLNRELLSNIVSGTITGGLEGAANYVNEGESRLENATEGATNGAISAGIFSGLKYGGKKLLGLGKWAANIPKAFPKGGAKELADEVAVFGRDAVEGTKKALYSIPENVAKESGLMLPPPTGAKFGKILSEGGAEEAITDYFIKKNHTYDAANDVVKDLGKFIRDLESKHVKSGLLKGERQALKQAKALQNQVWEGMLQGFNDIGRPDAAKALIEADKYFVENVLPHRHRLVETYRKGQLLPKDFLKKAYGDSTFMAHFGTKYPEIKLRQLLPKYLKGGAGALGVGGLGGIGYQLFKDK